MPQNEDKVVSKVYETYDYDKFTVLPENRGHVFQKGIKERKVLTLQRIINAGRWIPNMTKVRVNEAFEIIDGAHTFTVCKINQMPIRYEIISGEHFNNVTKREKIGNIYNINANTTSWTPAELFQSAVQTKAPLALIMNELINANDNTFVWTDVLALLTEDSTFFGGRWRKADMKTFEQKDLIEKIKSAEFLSEFNYFIKFNAKARIAQRKSTLLAAGYDILWNARDMINPRLFRKSLGTIPDQSILADKVRNHEGARRMLLSHYNRTEGQTVEVTAVLYQLKQKTKDAATVLSF